MTKAKGQAIVLSGGRMGLLASKLNTQKMPEDRVSKMSQEIVRRLLAQCNPVRIYLFGSTASESMTDNSDFDIALIFKAKELAQAEKKKIFRAALFPDIPVDLLFFDQKTFETKAQMGGVCWEILNKGKVIYDQRTKV